jgi:hypothetical protein
LCTAFGLAAQAGNPHYYSGPPVSLGNGTLQTYVLVNGAGKTLEVGTRFSADALSGLPTAPSDGTWDVRNADGETVYPCCGHENFLELPEEVEDMIPFRYVIVNWNPEGHVPPGVYDVPHFDFHFYTFPNEERLSIEAPLVDDACIVEGPEGPSLVPLTCEDYAEAVMPLPADQQPPGYTNVGAVEPGMGNHLLDLTSPEWTGEPFTHTWIFGSYSGRLTFWEPMITVEFLESLQVGSGGGQQGPKQVLTSISTPEAAPQAGWYPTRYVIRYLPSVDEYTVALTSFQWLPESTGQ